MIFLMMAMAFAEEVTVAVSKLPLPAGRPLTWDDLATASLPPSLVPVGAVIKGADLVGRVLRYPVAGRSPIVAQRLVDPPAASASADALLAVDLGPLAAIVRLGDRVVATSILGDPPTACAVALAEVRAVDPTRVALTAGSLADPMGAPRWVVGGPGAGALLPACEATP